MSSFATMHTYHNMLPILQVFKEIKLTNHGLKTSKTVSPPPQKNAIFLYKLSEHAGILTNTITSRVERRNRDENKSAHIQPGSCISLISLVSYIPKE